MSSGSTALFGFGTLPLALGALVLFGPPPAPAIKSVTITANEFALQAPDTVEAGPVTFNLLNQGKEFHHVWIVRLEEGRTMQDVHAALKNPGPPPAWLREIGGPNAPMPEGGKANATVMLQPGTYVLGCWIPSADGVPHIMKGMIRELTVVPAKHFVPAPAATVKMTLNDYGFTLSRPLTPGRHVIEVRNLAEQPHEIELASLADGKSVHQLLEWTHKPAGPAPGIAIGGVSPIDRGEVAWFEVDVKPGRYALICFLPDAKDGKPHFAHGMVQEIEVRQDVAGS
ncbi:MAG TPA: hypothetical protein VHG35_16945 [Gemmatimonadales bacterium]|nr:hypothetical protein [Gemmatimonadales bacterium]